MNTKYIAPYLIRSYVWELLQRNLDMSDDDYDINGDGKGLIPIVPLGEEPELAKFNKPYLVYGYAESPYDDYASQTTGNIMFAIYSTNFADMSQIANVIGKAFEYDDAAANVNHYTSTIPAFVGIRFGNVQLQSIEGGVPEESSGGRMSAVVNIKYEYYADYSIETSFATYNAATGKYIKTL